ncbi:efflux RND transporter periplasmic adaptor subunit [Candidatus Uhrbacteria bacterium]|nr:efflux RND transporter periplasmic adaptor subunit [Candidatus Uhrbacteria bacterium]
MTNFLKKIMKRKIIFFIVIILVIGGGYVGYKKFFSPKEEIRYVVDTVKKGTLITSVSGSGQISASNQVDVKAKASGDITSIAVHDGQEIKANEVLAILDARDAQKAVRDTQVNLESARIAYKKLLQPADSYAVLQAQNALESTRNTLKKILKPADEDAVLQMENAVASARDALEKLKLFQPDEYQKTEEAKKKAQDNLAKAYDDAFNAIANDFVSLPIPMTNLYDILYSDQIGASEASVGRGQWNVSALVNTTFRQDGKDRIQSFGDAATQNYKRANTTYVLALSDYKGTSRSSDRDTIDRLLNETIDMTKAISQAAKSESDLLNAWSDDRTQNNLTVFAKVKEYQASLANYISQTNTNISTLLGIQRTIQDNRETIAGTERSLKQMDQNNPLDLSAAEASLKQKESALAKLRSGADSIDIANAQAAVKEKESALAKLKAGPDVVDIQSQQLTVKQRENALLDAREKLTDYTIRAPFDGIVAKINAKIGDPISPSAAFAIFITKQQTADISLNEVDVSRVAVGQKTTLTFDAIPNISLTGEVAEIDTIGTMSQGVVTYNVKIVFDTQDDRVKPGMSINASVITNIHQDVLVILNSALKTRGNAQVVEVFDPPLPDEGQGNQGILSSISLHMQTVEAGLSNDTFTEILSGLKEGEQIVTKTITKTTEKNNGTQAPSIFGSPGGGNRNFGGGGGVRIGR